MSAPRVNIANMAVNREELGVTTISTVVVSNLFSRRRIPDPFALIYGECEKPLGHWKTTRFSSRKTTTPVLATLAAARTGTSRPLPMSTAVTVWSPQGDNDDDSQAGSGHDD